MLVDTGIVLEYRKQRKTKQKILDLFDIEQEWVWNLCYTIEIIK